MTCLISLCSFKPPKTLIKDLQAQREGSDGHLHRANRVTVIHLMVPKAQGVGILSAEHCHDHIVAHLRHYSEPIFRDCNVPCSPVMISGFWVGPDVEDGWGFVEALVNRIS